VQVDRDRRQRGVGDRGIDRRQGDADQDRDQRVAVARGVMLGVWRQYGYDRLSWRGGEWIHHSGAAAQGFSALLPLTN
jgi:hypothetical protein